jgi:hypothetical protein
MKQLLEKSNLLKCKHNEMQGELISLLSSYAKTNSLQKSDFRVVATEILDFISARCKDQGLLDSYKLFILNKIKLAFNCALKVPKQEFEVSDDMMDIPIEEFEGAKTDEEFVKLMGWVE